MTKLFEEFPPVSTEQWMEVVQKDLKGADFDKRLTSVTLDGVNLKPFYRAEDLPPEPICGELRGYRAGGNNWTLREEIRESDIAVANAHILAALNRGAAELAIYGYPMGPQVRTQGDMQRLLDGVIIEAVPIHWISGPVSAQTLAMLVNEARRRGIGVDQLRGSVDLAPIMDYCAAWVDGPVGRWKDDLLSVSRFILDNMPNYGLVMARGSFVEKSGASLAQELAIILALMSEYLDVYGDALRAGTLKVPGTDSVEAALAQIVSRSEIRIGIATHYFLEIAKLRAARVLLRNLLDSYGVNEARPKIHGITTSSNKTLYDPYNNLLRATIESMAAVVAGVDSLTVAAYDQGYNTPDEFSEHLARNTETLLKEEAYLGKVSDPLGGSYTVESLTHSYANAAWDLFKRIEQMGGFTAAWQSGFIAQELDRIRAARANQVSSRRRTIVGTTVYPNLKEQRLKDVQERGPVKQVRMPDAAVEDLAALFAGGASLDQWITDKNVPSTAVDPFRPSWPFEHLRLRVERSVADGGKRPTVFLAKMGDLTMRQARAGFCLGFFGAAGYDIREDTFSNPRAAADAAKAAGADALVLCSSDAEYADLVDKIHTDLPIVIAGNPESAEELKAKGVSDFVHVRVDLLDALTRFHEKFGVREMPV